MFSADHFDVFADDEHDDEHGSTSDYWEAFADALESRGFRIIAPLPLLSDDELAELSEDADLFDFDSDDERDEFLAAVFEHDSLAAEDWDERYYEGVVNDADVDVWRSIT